MIAVPRTGPAAQLNLMGYAQPSQTAHGIHMRLRARAFIIAEPKQVSRNNSLYDFEENDFVRPYLRSRKRTLEQGRSLLSNSALADPERTICFVSMDAGMVRVF